MSIEIGEVHSGRDTNITQYEAPAGWKFQVERELGKLQGLDTINARQVYGKVVEEVEGERDPTILKSLFNLMRDIAPSVAQVLVAALPWLAQL